MAESLDHWGFHGFPGGLHIICQRPRWSYVCVVNKYLNKETHTMHRTYTQAMNRRMFQLLKSKPTNKYESPKRHIMAKEIKINTVWSNMINYSHYCPTPFQNWRYKYKPDLFQPANPGQCKPKTNASNFQHNPLIPEPPCIPPTREPLGLASSL